MPLLRKNLNRPDEVRKFPRSQTELFDLGDSVIGRQAFEPGWRWSVDTQPVIGTDWCEVFHQGVVISGRLRVAMSDGPELDLGPGDLFEVPSGHDAWVIGDEAFVSVDFAGRRHFAEAEASGGRHAVATVLFTDLVDSTQTAERLGDAARRGVIAEHNIIVDARSRSTGVARSRRPETACWSSSTRPRQGFGPAPRSLGRGWPGPPAPRRTAFG